MNNTAHHLEDRPTGTGRERTAVSEPAPNGPGGTPCEVLSRFTQHWSPGFEVVEASPGAIRVRRVSDGALIPESFHPTEIRTTPFG